MRRTSTRPCSPRPGSAFFRSRRCRYTQNYLAAGGTRAFSEYYHANYDGAAVDRRLADTAVFAQRNLVSDRSFNEFHVIVCRNVMIYFDRSLKGASSSCSTRASPASACSRSATRRRPPVELRRPIRPSTVEKLYLAEGRMRYELIVIEGFLGRTARRRRHPLRAPAGDRAAVVVAQHRRAGSDEGGLAELLRLRTLLSGRRRRGQGADRAPAASTWRRPTTTS